MALGIAVSSGGGDGNSKPYIQYDAKAGRAFRVDRFQDSQGAWETKKVDITRDLTFIADLANIKVGWMHFPRGAAPTKRLSLLGKEPIPPRPEEKNEKGQYAFKQGFEIDLLLSKAHGGGPARELSSTAGCVIEAMDGLHDAYSAAPEAHAGKLPVVALKDTIPVKSGQSTNYKPIFEIVGWQDRPSGLPNPTIRPTASATATPPSTGSTQAPPPAARPAPQPAAMDASDFG